MVKDGICEKNPHNFFKFYFYGIQFGGLCYGNDLEFR